MKNDLLNRRKDLHDAIAKEAIVRHIDSSPLPYRVNDGWCILRLYDLSEPPELDILKLVGGPG